MDALDLDEEPWHDVVQTIHPVISLVFSTVQVCGALSFAKWNEPKKFNNVVCTYVFRINDLNSFFGMNEDVELVSLSSNQEVLVTLTRKKLRIVGYEAKSSPEQMRQERGHVEYQLGKVSPFFMLSVVPPYVIGTKTSDALRIYKDAATDPTAPFWIDVLLATWARTHSIFPVPHTYIEEYVYGEKIYTGARPNCPHYTVILLPNKEPLTTATGKGHKKKKEEEEEKEEKEEEKEAPRLVAAPPTSVSILGVVHDIVTVDRGRLEHLNEILYKPKKAIRKGTAPFPVKYEQKFKFTLPGSHTLALAYLNKNALDMWAKMHSPPSATLQLKVAGALLALPDHLNQTNAVPDYLNRFLDSSRH